MKTFRTKGELAHYREKIRIEIARTERRNRQTLAELRQRGETLTPDEKAYLTLLELYELWGAGAVFLVLRYGKKAPPPAGWNHQEWEATQKPEYQGRLLAAIKRGGNIAVLLGQTRAIDIDRDDWLNEFLIQNPHLAGCLRTKGAKGGQIFFELPESADFPNGQAFYPLTRNGEKFGEWRPGGANGERGAYSVIFGRHPDGMDYSVVVASPIAELDGGFSSIKWPADIALPWSDPKPATGQPAGGGANSAEAPESAFEGAGGVADQAGGAEGVKTAFARGADTVLTPILWDRITKYLDKMESAIQGEAGSQPTYRAACVLSWGFGLGREDTAKGLKYYSRKCIPPWSDSAEFWHKVDEALKEDRHQKPFGYLLREQEPRASAGAGDEEADQTVGAATRTAKFKAWVDKRPEELSREFPPVLIPGWLYQGRRMMVTGKPIMGKGLFLLQTAFCLATGTQFLTQKLGAPKRVYHVDFELMEASLWERLWKACEYFSRGQEAEQDRLWALANENIKVLSTVDHPELLYGPATDFFAEIMARAAEHKAIFASFDPLWRICPSELDERSLREFLRELALFTRQTRAGVCYAQHQTKGDQSKKDVIDRFSGRNDLARDCATMVVLTELDTFGRIQVDVRTNDFAQPEPFVIKLAYPVFELDFETRPAGNKNQRIPASEAAKAYGKAPQEDGDGWVWREDLVQKLIDANSPKAPPIGPPIPAQAI